MAWTIDTIRMAAEGEKAAMRADLLAKSNVDAASTGVHADHYVTPEGLQEIADALGTRISRSPHNTYFVYAFGVRFFTPMPWAD